MLTALAAKSTMFASPQCVLVSGDAGIGKTTLVHAVVERARLLGVPVGVGHCVDISAGVPFAPVVESLRQLAGPDVSVPATDTPEAVGVLVRAMADLMSERPGVVVLEDVHWADHYSTDFARLFVRTAEARALLLMTYRSEDVGATAGFRDALVDLRRSDAVTLLPLGPLGPAVMAALAVRRTGRALDADEALWLHRRSEGNPLYAEEILTAERGEVPLALADLLTRHLRKLRPPTRALVRLAAASSSVVDVQTLALVAALPSEAAEAALHEAMDANVMVRQGDGLAFRHALLRDAVYEELLPTERVRLHRRYVRVLAGRLAVATRAAERWPIAADLAFHASAAGDLTTELSGHVAAAQAARRFGARRDAAGHYESALALWGQVPTADRPPNVTRPDLHRLAAESLYTLGEPVRIRAHLQHALSMLDEDTDAQVASRVYAAVASIMHLSSDAVSDEDAAFRAVALAGPQPSVARVEAMLAMAHLAERRNRFAAVLDHVTAAQEASGQLGHPPAQPEFLILEGNALFLLGRCAEGVERLKDAAALAMQSGDVGEATDQTAAAASWLLFMGKPAESEALARSSRVQAQSAGLTAKVAFGIENEIYALIFTGRFTQAERLLEDISTYHPPEFRVLYLSTTLALARGDLDRVRELQRRRDPLLGDLIYQPYDDAPVHRATLYRALGNQDLEVSWARRYIDETADTDSPLLASVAAYVGLYALSGAPASPARDALREPAYRAMGFAQAQLTSDWAATWHAAHLSYARAYAARLAGRSAVDEWSQGAHRAARVGAYIALQPRLELAAEHLRAGDRATGKQQLTSLWQDAQAMGAGAYERQAAALATRNRVPLPDDGKPIGPLHRLTAREQEVLALLANGATDKDVAATLVISTRTASIHVGNILAKLQVPNRGAAAKLARDLHVDTRER